MNNPRLLAGKVTRSSKLKYWLCAAGILVIMAIAAAIPPLAENYNVNVQAAPGLLKKAKHSNLPAVNGGLVPGRGSDMVMSSQSAVSSSPGSQGGNFPLQGSVPQPAQSQAKDEPSAHPTYLPAPINTPAELEGSACFPSKYPFDAGCDPRFCPDSFVSYCGRCGGGPSANLFVCLEQY